MSSTWSHHSNATMVEGNSQDFDDAEKGLYDNTEKLSIIPYPSLARLEKEKEKNTVVHIENIQSPLSPIHEGITPFSSVPILSLSWPAGREPPKAVSDSSAKKPTKPREEISRWIFFQLWFNTYRKFFTFVTLLNLVGIIMASLGRFRYAENHLGALVLGNLLMAVLMRNELFLRFLYTISIYGLRSVSSTSWLGNDGADKNLISGLH
jgi:hypothetical protein